MFPYISHLDLTLYMLQKDGNGPNKSINDLSHAELNYHQPKNVKTGFVIAGRRHCNCIMTMAIFLEDDLTRDRLIYLNKIGVEGFLTSDNRFLDRAEACKEAIENGQVDKDKVSGVLYSEDLY